MRKPYSVQYDPPEPPNSLEAAILLEIGERPSDFVVTKREYTGVGGYIYFSSEDVEVVCDHEINLVVQIPEIENDFGVVGYRKEADGKSKGDLFFLEFYTFGDAWWLDYSSFAIKNISNQETLPE